MFSARDRVSPRAPGVGGGDGTTSTIDRVANELSQFIVPHYDAFPNPLKNLVCDHVLVTAAIEIGKEDNSEFGKATSVAGTPVAFVGCLL